MSVCSDGLLVLARVLGTRKKPRQPYTRRLHPKPCLPPNKIAWFPTS